MQLRANLGFPATQHPMNLPAAFIGCEVSAPIGALAAALGR